MVNETINNLLTRRSVRNYKPDQIKAEELEIVLKAGSYAPSGKGLQSVMMIAVQSELEIEKWANIYNQVRNTIGNNVVIGAGSVVTKDIPSDVVAYGNPCKVQKNR